MKPTRKEIEKLAKKLRLVANGGKVVPPTWRKMHSVYRRMWRDVARYVLTYYQMIEPTPSNILKVLHDSGVIDGLSKPSRVRFPICRRVKGKVVCS